MKTVRTSLSKHDTTDFRLFLDNINLTEVMIGNYEDINDKWYRKDCLCYAYSEKSTEVVAILTYISLKYGNIQTAYRDYMKAVMISTVNDPYFNWTP